VLAAQKKKLRSGSRLSAVANCTAGAEPAACCQAATKVALALVGYGLTESDNYAVVTESRATDTARALFTVKLVFIFGCLDRRCIRRVTSEIP
jgi:hypothetical protein